MLFIGCDPGLTGALALVGSHAGLLECTDIPVGENGLASGSMTRWVDARGVRDVIFAWSRRHDFARESVFALVERPIAMPTLPAQTVASQFDTFGAVRAILTASLPPHAVKYVTPQEWKRKFGIGSDKAKAREVAAKLYPSAPVTRVKDHNRAEAILIAHFGKVWLA